MARPGWPYEPGWAGCPRDCTGPHIVGVGALAGIGYTVSLFIADVAFQSRHPSDAAEVALLAASLIAATAGAAILRFSAGEQRKPFTHQPRVVT